MVAVKSTQLFFSDSSIYFNGTYCDSNPLHAIFITTFMRFFTNNRPSPMGYHWPHFWLNPLAVSRGYHINRYQNYVGD